MNGQAASYFVERALNGPHRRHKRFRTQSLLLDNPVVGRVVNVGQTGFAVEMLEGLSVGENYVFKVRLGEKHLRLSGRVQWCRLTSIEAAGDSDALPVYKAGVALAKTVTSKAWQAALKRLTEDPAYLIWHRARSKTSENPLGELASAGAAKKAPAALELIGGPLPVASLERATVDG